jgi:hypothetical protein
MNLLLLHPHFVDIHYCTSLANAWSRLTDFSSVMSKSHKRNWCTLKSLEEAISFKVFWKSLGKKSIKLSICHHLCVFGGWFIKHGKYSSVGLFSSGFSCSKFVLAGSYHNYTSYHLQHFKNNKFG